MQEISLNILDIVQNSIRAQATLITVEIEENPKSDVFSFSVRDNGCGMDRKMLEKVTDPFVTTRTTRKVGLGISLLKAAAIQAGGDVQIESTVGEGTFLKADFSYSSIDRQPLGDIAGAMMSVISTNPDTDFVYRHIFENREFVLETKKLREILGEEVKLSEVSVARWIKEYIDENLTEIYGGAK